jgi:hypothetical protein
MLATPDLIIDAAAHLDALGSQLTQAHSAAALSTVAVAPPATDEVSNAIAALFSDLGQNFQTLGARAGAFHQSFTGQLTGSAAAYSSTEAANANPLNIATVVALDVIFLPIALPLIALNVLQQAGLVGGHIQFF